ncbi:MAG: glycosyltransferase family 2 protein [Vicinamibacterales bacterium]
MTCLAPGCGAAALDPTAIAEIVIPALNEEPAIGRVISRVPYPAAWIIVVDNGSTDRTAAIAREAGARVVVEPRRGYGRACLAGLREQRSAPIVVFLDADLSEDPRDVIRLVEPITSGGADFVLGRRVGHGRPWHARAGTRLCVALINALWGSSYTDLGPLRAIRRDALDALQMRDVTWGWTIEMQIKAYETGLRTVEIPVETRARLGQSKISGTVSGSVRAGGKMLATIAGLWATRTTRTAAR